MNSDAASVEWVDIPAGQLIRGTPVGELDGVLARHADLPIPMLYIAKESPRMVIDVPGFKISKVPVTVSLWSKFTAEAGWDPPGDLPGDLPADGVEWWQANAFCQWLSEVTGAEIALPGNDEWERAARGDDDREYPWGNEWDRRCANTAELGIGTYLPVGTLLRGSSPYGVLDLAGNVDEWLRDEYFPYPGAPASVPEREDWALDPHMTRGGNYHHRRDLARCARRHGIYEGSAHGRGAGIRLISH